MVDPLPIEGKGALLLFGMVAVDHAVYHVARVELLDELQRAGQADWAAFGA